MRLHHSVGRRPNRAIEPVPGVVLGLPRGLHGDTPCAPIVAIDGPFSPAVVTQRSMWWAVSIPCLNAGTNAKQGAGPGLNLETVFPGLFMPHNLSKVPILPRPKVREPVSRTGARYYRRTGETPVPQMPDRQSANLPHVGRAVKVESKRRIRSSRAEVPLAWATK